MPEAEPVHFTEAIDYFKNKVRLPTDTWSDLWKEQHARAFVVAGATKDALLTDFQTAISKALEQGTTLAEFRKDFDNIVASHGWEYNGGSGWRSRVIYQTNLRMSQSAGRWKQIERTKKRRPYIRYTAIRDDRNRPEHKAWHDTVLPVDHPWWETHNPPNGWGCRCKVQSLSVRDLKRYDLKVSDEAPAIRMEDRQVNTPDGKVSRPTPEGIDTGFDYNVGQAAWGRQLSDNAHAAFKATPGKNWQPLNAKTFEDYNRPVDVPMDKPVAKLGPPITSGEAMAKAVQKSLGKTDDIVFELKDGSPLAINAASLADHLGLERGPLVPFLKEVIEDPFEIWLAFEKNSGTGKVVLRKRIIKTIDIPKHGRFMFVANATNGRFEGWTFFAVKNEKRLRQARYGMLLYGR